MHSGLQELDSRLALDSGLQELDSGLQELDSGLQELGLGLALDSGLPALGSELPALESEVSLPALESEESLPALGSEGRLGSEESPPSLEHSDHRRHPPVAPRLLSGTHPGGKTSETPPTDPIRCSFPNVCRSACVERLGRTPPSGGEGGA
eukprot:9491062-Pyramimonas_sp.AAC.1